ncbi:MAG: tRNA (N(6)-L-threonylcarbamoyladenosine(37)-C(2))-methylthiotransferase MtaB [Treponema sp.]|nr:tRNA (N(6)-L-threonylcarbamoyladenosine(37)-C(2))-methylthiotransferase MtaB [Treponema sp.]
MYKIRIETLGCRLNQIESESIAKLFIDEGYEVSMESVTSKSLIESNTSICIINTCTVTQKAEQKARRIIRLMLQKFPDSVVVVTGCYAQLAAKEISKIDRRICVIPGQIKSRLEKLPKILKDYNSIFGWDPVYFAEKICDELLAIPVLKKDFPENSFKLSTSSFIAHSRASLKIQDGCNNNCSFCAIHIARGHSVSIPVETALLRVRELERAGQAEVVITSVNLGQYKNEYEGKEIRFPALLKLMLANTKTIKFRISSLYPELVDEDFCEAISDERVQPHFHLSVQSGSNKILKAMNRLYTAQDVAEACKKIRSVKNNPFIACDIITGFPGETDEDFKETMELCRICNFTWVHAFPYSERPGTVAAIMKNKVPQSISGEREAELTAFAVENKIKYIKSIIGKKYSAVLETSRRQNSLVTKQIEYVYHAVTDNFIHCEIKSQRNLGQLTKVEIEILDVLTDRIQKGGEIETSAKII